MMRRHVVALQPSRDHCAPTWFRAEPSSGDSSDGGLVPRDGSTTSEVEGQIPGQEGATTWVELGILAHNLRKVGVDVGSSCIGRKVPGKLPS